MTDGKQEIAINIYCNGEYIMSESDKYDRINAVASLIAEREIRGEVILLVSEDAGEQRGFLSENDEDSICELWAVRNVLGRIH